MSSPSNPDNPPAVHQPSESAEFGIGDIIDFLLEQKWLIVATTVAIAIVAAVLALTATPVYRVEAVLAPVTEDRGSTAAALSGQFASLASIAGLSLGGGGAKEEALGIMKSRALTARFIEENRLLPVIYADRWDERNRRWRITEDAPTVWRAVNRFQDEIQTITQDPATGLVTLRVEWNDPVVAAYWAAALVRMTNEAMRRREVKEAAESIEFLKVELGKTSLVEVQQAISRVIETQTKALTMASIRGEFAFRVIDPPIAPDLSAPVRPQKRAMVAVGLVLGAMLGVFLAILRVGFARHLRRRRF